MGARSVHERKICMAGQRRNGKIFAGTVVSEEMCSKISPCRGPLAARSRPLPGCEQDCLDGSLLELIRLYKPRAAIEGTRARSERSPAGRNF